MNPDPPFNFEPEPTPPEWVKFEVGELIRLKGYIFRIDAIRADGIVLRPVQKAQEADMI